MQIDAVLQYSVDDEEAILSANAGLLQAYDFWHTAC